VPSKRRKTLEVMMKLEKTPSNGLSLGFRSFLNEDEVKMLNDVLRRGVLTTIEVRQEHRGLVL
jgi:hypothetical protein